MLLLLDDKHKEHLQHITDFNHDVVQEFCRISIEAVKKGFNNKAYSSAANKLGVEAEVVQNGIKSLVYLFTEATKLRLGDMDFHDSLMTLGITKEVIDMLLLAYKENSDELRSILADMDISFPQYKDLKWRLDVQLASRSLQHQMEPLITMQLKLNKKGRDECINLQTDPVNLVHMTQVFEQALQEMKNQHCRRVTKHIK